MQPARNSSILTLFSISIILTITMIAIIMLTAGPFI
jgi:hypothetical protein